MISQFDYFLHTNLTYLREKIGLSINDLGEITEIDPIDIHILETRPFEDEISRQQQADLMNLANYFCVLLSDLCLTDLRQVNLDDEFYKGYFLEYTKGFEVNRKPFYKYLQSIECPKLSNDATPLEEAKQLLLLIHQAYKSFN